MDQGIMSLAPFLLIFVVMYFLMIRPQSKKQKELEKLRSELKEGDSVLTSGGIYGKVVGIEADNKIIKIKVDNSCSIRIDKSSIASVLKEEK
jgi:preprotein translocase subunit YajC